ncbi:MAG: GNAT family protein [Sedimentisphaerales bacterium]
MFRPAGAKEIRDLFKQYLSPTYEPFFVDISGPELLMNFRDFSKYCRQDAALWISAQDETIEGFFLLFDIQPSLALANFDIVYFSGFPRAGSVEVAALATALRKACRQTRVTRLQLLALAREREKLTLAAALGFRREGTLQQHFFHKGGYHDLIVLARMERGRDAS